MKYQVDVKFHCSNSDEAKANAYYKTLQKYGADAKLNDQKKTSTISFSSSSPSVLERLTEDLKPVDVLGVRKYVC